MGTRKRFLASTDLSQSRVICCINIIKVSANASRETNLNWDKQIQRIVVPRFRGLIVRGAIIMSLYQ